ncbi:hypothetical protein [Rhodococcus sp. X156]|uniref:hypothetical protein n=1 Tax=Rhodococcus sp. X156 TaxID=2499145 RepID=UPI000FD94EDF|nr:hypothetical protein [Rhodococcus sp. X156]
MSDPAEHDLELTTSALKAGPTDLGLAGGVLEIERWQNRLDGVEGPLLEEIGGMLAELRGELESDAPDPAVAADLMRRLGNQCVLIAEQMPPGNMHARLRELGNELIEGAAEV